MEENEIKEFADNHKVGFCLKPDNLDEMPALSASRSFMAPKQIDLRDYCTPCEDQGNKPWCAAYSAANWAENILWRKNDYIDQIDPAPIYQWAKQHDGSPYTDGTSLTAVLEALLAQGKFSRNECAVKVIRNNRLAFKYAMHKFGCVLCGFNISEAWYRCSKADPVVHDNVGAQGIGGHAVIACGYNRDGVWIQNSWGATNWGEWGFGFIPWEVFDKQFMYGAVLSGCLNGMTLNA